MAYYNDGELDISNDPVFYDADGQPREVESTCQDCDCSPPESDDEQTSSSNTMYIAIIIVLAIIVIILAIIVIVTCRRLRNGESKGNSYVMS